MGPPRTGDALPITVAKSQWPTVNLKWPVLDGYEEQILLPEGLRVKLTNSRSRNEHENGDDTGVSLFCNEIRFPRCGAVANPHTMHVLRRNQHCCYALAWASTASLVNERTSVNNTRNKRACGRLHCLPRKRLPPALDTEDGEAL